jgi:DNA-binding GntR family transcriptional regulator
MVPETVGESAYRAIRQDIIFGRLAPGQKLKLEPLRARYGVSVSTLREILSRLCSEGFVVAEGQRGFEVEPVSAAGFREVAAMRLLLECSALEASFPLGDLEWEAHVIGAYHKLSVLEERMQSGDRSGAELWKRYDREFHVALVRGCGSEVLLEAHASIYDKYLRYQMVADIYRGEPAAREHRQLLKCALKRNVEEARRVLVRHVEDCVEIALGRKSKPWLESKTNTDRTRTASARTKGERKSADRRKATALVAGRATAKRKAGADKV